MPFSRSVEPRVGRDPNPASEPRAGDAAGASCDRRAVHLACTLAREISSAMFDVPVAEINRRNRSPAPTCQARHVAMYLAHVAMRVSLSAIAEEFGRDRTSVAHAVRRIEDRRDDAGFDALLTRLERLAGACGAVASQPVGPGSRREG